MKLKKIKAFTLVELIIVITILAILATLSFVSFNGYLKNARDGNRVSTFNWVKKWLDIFYTKVWNYPQVDDKKSSWEVFWVFLTQVGFIWTNVSQLIQLKTIPTDPLTGDRYLYGVDHTGNKYQIGAILENQLSYNSFLVPQTYANSKEFISKVDGNYWGTIKFQTWGNIYLSNIPSLLHSNIWNVSLIATGTWYVVDKMKNLPYAGSGTQLLESTEIIKKITNNPNATLTGINITNINSSNISWVFSWDLLESFWWDLISISKEVLWSNTTLPPPVTPAICNSQEDGSSGVCRDPDWPSVSLLLKWEDFTDSTGKNTLSTFGNTRIDNSRVKYWSSSIYFDGTGDYATIADNTHFDFWTAPFTIEAWVNTDARVWCCDRIIAWGNNSDGWNNQWFLWAWPWATLDFWYWGWSSYVESAPSVWVWNNNEWYHVAIVRNGANVYYFWNGILRSTWNIWAGVSINTGSYGITLWARYHNGSVIEFLHGNIDELRITKWVARYTSNFTLPTQSLASE